MATASWTDQRAPALAIVARGDQITALAAAEWSVASQSRPGEAYTVRGGASWSCTCAHHAETGRACIHVLAVRFRNDLQAAGAPDVAAKPPCPVCGAVQVVSNGKRHNAHGSIQRFLCRACGHRFAERSGFEGRHAEPRTIALALDLYFRGLSVRKVADHFRQAQGVSVSHMTVYRWIVHYSRLAAKWLDAQGVRTGERWHVDETVINVDGARRYLWNVLDADTRFLLAVHVSRVRGHADARAPLKKAKKATPDRPEEVFTDGMQAYAEAVKKEFGHTRKGVAGYWSPHRRVPSIRAAESNNRIERMHGSQKERTKVMRAFDTDHGAASIAEGWRVHYNAVRDHQALGVTPAEAAGLPRIDGFRWLDVLQKATASPAPLQAGREGGSHPEK